MRKQRLGIAVITTSLCPALSGTAAGAGSEEAILQMLANDRPYHAVPERLH